MKYLLPIAIASTVLAAGAVQAQERRDFGAGIILGEPTGVSLKKWLGNGRAVDAGLAWSFSGENSLHFHADYLFHRFDLLTEPDMQGSLPIYYGFGGRVKLDDDDNGVGDDDDDRLGVRVPVGISYMPDNAPVDVFAEIAPVLDLAPDTDVDLNGAIGARFYF